MISHAAEADEADIQGDSPLKRKSGLMYWVGVILAERNKGVASRRLLALFRGV